MTDTDVNIALKSIDALETRERLLDVESLLSGDKYIFVKDAYMQSINYEISDGIDVDDTLRMKVHVVNFVDNTGVKWTPTVSYTHLTLPPNREV